MWLYYETDEFSNMSEAYQTELMTCVMLGLGLSYLLVLFGSRVGHQLQGSNDNEHVSSPLERDPSVSATDNLSTEEEPFLLLNPEKTAEKMAPLQRMLGLTDEQMMEAIHNTNSEIVDLNTPSTQQPSNLPCSGSPSTTSGASGSHPKIFKTTKDSLNALPTDDLNAYLDFFVYASVAIAAVYILSTSTDTDFYRALKGIFPTELSSVNLDAGSKRLTWLKQFLG